MIIISGDKVWDIGKSRSNRLCVVAQARVLAGCANGDRMERRIVRVSSIVSV